MSHTSRVLGCLALAIALVWPAVAGAGTITAEGAGYEIEVSSLMKTSGNKADAKKFFDWLLTPAAAKLYGERAELSTVPGSKPPEAVLATGLPADASMVLYKMDFDWSAKNRDRILSRWKKDIER
jgi:iron(III) transport system substrate-binding protein